MDDRDAEIARLRALALRLAERIFLAHEILGRLAEKKEPAASVPSAPDWRYDFEESTLGSGR